MFSKPPSVRWISLLIASYNTPVKYIQECLDSIQSQQGWGTSFHIELVWINDGSLPAFSQELVKTLKHWEKQNKNRSKIKYFEWPTNKGLSYSLHHGVLLCSYDLIFRMDSDDIMHESRIQKQLDFMNLHPRCVLCGTNLVSFMKDPRNEQTLQMETSNHDSLLTWEQYKKTKKSWILNHPTLCFRKYAVISVGNYNQWMKDPFEDLDLELRLLKKYGFVCNLPDILLYYRVHENQITWLERKNTKENNEKKERMIEEIIQS